MKKNNYLLLFTLLALIIWCYNVSKTINTSNIMIAHLKRQIKMYQDINFSKFDKLFKKLNKTVNIVENNDKFLLERNINQQNDIKNLQYYLLKLEEIIDKKAVENFKINEQIKENIKKLKKKDISNVDNIIKANIRVLNSTNIRYGSGTHIIINNKHYILTCAHLVNKDTDFIWGELDNNDLHPLELIKIDKNLDLALFKIWNVENLPSLKISNIYPKEGSEVVVIGNPIGVKDYITDGIIVQIMDKGYIFTNLIYYGNSGGAIIYDGKLVGVVSQIRVHNKYSVYVNYGYGIKLKKIKEFLGDIWEIEK